MWSIVFLFLINIFHFSSFALCYFRTPIDVNVPALRKVGLVHRIDKNTSGLMVVAKTEYAMAHLAKQFYNHTIHRRRRNRARYLARVTNSFRCSGRESL